MSKSSRLFAAASAALIALAGCSDDDESSTTTTTFEIGSPATIITPATAFPTVATIGPVPVTQDTTDIALPPSDTGDIPIVPVDTADAPVFVGVVVGENTGPDRVEIVPQGALVSLSIINFDAQDEFHLHGYDLGDGEDYAAGETATFTFTADTAGDFELESHDTGGVLLILRVR